MAADIIKEAIIRLGIELSKDGLDKLDLSKSTDQFKQHAAAVEATSAAIDQQKVKTNELDRANAQVGESSVKLREANLKAADALKQAGEGAFGAARGFAFLAASNSDNYEQMVRTIAVAQGAFDIFKGGVDVVRGLSEANKALTAASAASAAAEASKAAAIAAGGTAAAAAAPKLALMNVALGPVGIGIAAVTAAAVAGAGAWSQYGDEADDALDRINRKLGDQKRAQDLANEALRDANRERDRYRDVLDPDAAISDIQGELSRLSPDSPAGISFEARRLNRRFHQSFDSVAPGARPQGTARQADAARDQAIAQLQAEEQEADRRRGLTEEIARIQIRQREERLREVERELAKLEDDPLGNISGQGGQLRAEQAQLTQDIRGLKQGLVDAFREFRDEIADLQREVGELKRFKDLAVNR